MDLETTKLTVEWVAIERLFCSPANPRHNDEAKSQASEPARRRAPVRPPARRQGSRGD